MGNNFCIQKDVLSNPFLRNNNKRDTYLSSYNIDIITRRSRGKILREDDEFLKTEDWCCELQQITGTVLFDSHKFTLNYPNYKIDQVQKKIWTFLHNIYE